MADKAYSTRRIRTSLRGRGITATIPEPANQIAGRLGRASLGGRPPAFDREASKRRNAVERAFNKLRDTRAVATRYDCESTKAPSTSQPSESGSETQPSAICGTRPNIAVNPRVSVLVDHYDDDWTQLWWARADGTAQLRDIDRAKVKLLASRYPQYREQPPPGPLIVVTVERWSGLDGG